MNKLQALSLTLVLLASPFLGIVQKANAASDQEFERASMSSAVPDTNPALIYSGEALVYGILLTTPAIAGNPFVYLKDTNTVTNTQDAFALAFFSSNTASALGAGIGTHLKFDPPIRIDRGIVAAASNCPTGLRDVRLPCFTVLYRRVYR